MRAPVLVLDNSLERDSGSKVQYANIPASKVVADASFTPPSPPTAPVTPAAHLSSSNIIFIVFGSILGLALIVLTIWLVFFKKKKRTEHIVTPMPRADEEVENTKHVDEPPIATRIEGDCPCCREDMIPEGSLEVLPCGHVLHTACANRWIRPVFTCPLCRRSAQLSSME